VETARNGNNGTELQGVENARHEYSGKAEYGKPLIVEYMQPQTNNAVESFHAALRRRVKVAHTNLNTFLGHLQRATTDSEAEVARTNRGLSIRRSKKNVYIANDARIKT